MSYPAVLAALDPGDYVQFNARAPSAIETPELVVESVDEEGDLEVLCSEPSSGYPTHAVHVDDPEIELYEIRSDGESYLDDVVTISLVAVE